MSKAFTGTLTIAATEYLVTAQFTQRGNRLFGTVIFDEDASKVVPISVLNQNGDLTLAQPIFFTTPLAEVVQILPIASGASTVDSLFSLITINADIEVDEVSSEMELILSSQKAEQDPEPIEESAFPESELVIHPVERIRINEIGNTFDNMGAILSLKRHREEPNGLYKPRLRTKAYTKASSTVSGLIRGIAASTGIPILEAIRVKVLLSVADPSLLRLVLDGPIVRVFDKWVVSEDQIGGHEASLLDEVTLGVGAVQTIGNLVDWLNRLGVYSASLLDASLSTTSAIQLLGVDSIKSQTETLRHQHTSRLLRQNILQGTLFGDGLSREKEVGDLLTAAGDFTVDYTNGIVNAYSPELLGGISYLYSATDFIISTSEISVTDMTDKESQSILFSQVDRTFYPNILERTGNGLPTAEGYRLLREVLSLKFHQYWGE